MPNSREPKEYPSTLNEWTLEQEITSELKILFNSIYLERHYRNLYRRLGLPFFNPFNLFNGSCKSFKLTPIEENRTGGWDTRINIPEGYFRDARAMFIQYKRGYSQNGNSDPDSIFNTSIKNPNPYIEFEFNSNSGNNQHRILRELKNQLQIKGKSVNAFFYAFPRITDINHYIDLTESILLHTTFITVDQLDNEAPEGVDLGDNNPHFFRTDKTESNKREVCSNPFELKNTDQSAEFISEIIKIKFSRIWNEVIDLKYPERLKSELIDSLRISLCDFLGINPFENKTINFETILRNSYMIDELIDYFNASDEKRKAIHEKYNIDHENFLEKSIEIYYKVNSYIEQFLVKEKIDIQKSIPDYFTTSITEEGITLSINEDVKELDFVVQVI